MRALVVLLLSAVALAGCADEAGTVPEEELEGLEDLEATDTTGVIRGVVLDAAIVPIEGVTVAIGSIDRETTTNADGAFGFQDLEPGTYFLEFRKPGWDTTQSSTEVVAGVSAPPVLKVQMLRLPGTEPFYSALHYQGYIGCAFKAANYVFPNQCSAAGDPDRFDILDFGTQIVPETLQTEIVWRQTQEFGRDLGTIQYVENEAGERQRVGNVWGPSPLICRVELDAVCDNGDGTGGGGDGLNTTRFPGKYFASVYAACYQQCVPGTAVGAGIILQQDYDLYATAFFNYAPPEGWTLQLDGPFEPPA